MTTMMMMMMMMMICWHTLIRHLLYGDVTTSFQNLLGVRCTSKFLDGLTQLRMRTRCKDDFRHTCTTGKTKPFQKFLNTRQCYHITYDGTVFDHLRKHKNLLPSGEYSEQHNVYVEYANKASQWLVCLCSRSRSAWCYRRQANI